MSAGRSTFVRGSCRSMCPPQEFKIRKEHNLVRHFEVGFDTAVKCYSRSAAGQSTCRSEQVRDLNTLKKTVHYLLAQVVGGSRAPYLAVYDFVFDRLRAVRQDLVVQGYLEGCCGQDTLRVIQILASCVRFYVYSQYKLEAQATYNFSRHLNETHTAECLTQLLRLCAEFDAFASSSSSSWSTTSSLRLAWLEAEALHVLLSGHNTGLLRAQVLPEPLRSNSCLRRVVAIVTSTWTGNWTRAARLAVDLPLILQLAFRIRLSQSRPRLLQVYEKAYRTGPGTRFPLERLAASLWLDSADQAAALCRHHGLTVDEAAGVVVFRAGRADAAVAAADPPSTAPLAVPLSTHIEQQLRDVDVDDLLLEKSLRLLLGCAGF